MYIVYTLTIRAGAMRPTICPLGYREKNNAASDRYTFDSTCEPCPPGYFGARPDRSGCDDCRAGVVCMEGAWTDNPLGNDSVAHGVNSTLYVQCIFIPY